MPIDIKIEKFEGPFELLLDLIEREKLEITEISLAQVTDQYLAHLSGSDTISKEHLADFLVVASRLLLIKSRAILPMLTLTEEEETDIRDLTEHLKELQRYRDAAKVLRQMLFRNRPIYVRPLYAGRTSVFVPPKNIKAHDLRDRVVDILSQLEIFFQQFEKKVMKRVMSIEEKIKQLLGELEKRVQLQFQSLTEKKEKSEVIITFLALLFLFREQMVKLAQSTNFSEITVSNSMPNTPTAQ